MDGRDIGTVILPDAQVKIFMHAAPEIRAERRHKELLEKGKNVTYEEVYSDMCLRDKNDSSRAVAPCVPADDAVIFDNGSLSFDETVEHAIKIIKEKLS
jgi:cytidylate kinase